MREFSCWTCRANNFICFWNIIFVLYLSPNSRNLKWKKFPRKFEMKYVQGERRKTFYLSISSHIKKKIIYNKFHNFLFRFATCTQLFLHLHSAFERPKKGNEKKQTKNLFNVCCLRSRFLFFPSLGYLLETTHLSFIMEIGIKIILC